VTAEGRTRARPRNGAQGISLVGASTEGEFVLDVVSNTEFLCGCMHEGAGGGGMLGGGMQRSGWARSKTEGRREEMYSRESRDGKDHQTLKGR